MRTVKTEIPQKDLLGLKGARHLEPVSIPILEILFKELPLGMAIGDSQARLIRANPKFCKLLGYTEAELIGKSFKDFTYPDDLPRSELHKQNLMEKANTLAYTKRLLKKDGTTVLVRATNAVVNNPDGTLFGSLGIVEDLTREMELEYKQAQLASLVQSSSDGIFSLNLSGNIETWNRGAEKLYGYSSHEAIGKNLTQLLVGQPVELLSMTIENAKQGVGSSGIEILQRKKNGEYSPISLNVNPIQNEFHQVEGISIIAHDMSAYNQVMGALKASEEQTRKSSENLSRVNEELEQFAFVASHDLQEPLRTISCFLQLLEKKHDGKLDAQSTEYIHFAVQGAQRMQKLILDLLQFSRTSRYASDLKPVGLESILDRALSNLHGLLESEKVKVLRSPLPTVLSFDHQLTQVFQNLIGNAIKFRSVEPPRIQIFSERRDQQWIIHIQDNGIGFHSEHAERIFLIFQRLHTWEEYPGTGVGLAICKKIIEAHGGKIWAQSNQLSGATFSFSLPAVPVQVSKPSL